MSDLPQVAILDDFQNAALHVADWSPVAARAKISVFTDHLADPEALAARLAPFTVLCVMRERTPLPRSLLTRLPKLRLIASTGRRNAAIDEVAAAAQGIEIRHTGGSRAAPIELTWALILAAARHLPAEIAHLRQGGWQDSLGTELHGKVLGILGWGHLGSAVGRIGQAFGMRVITSSERLSAEAASAAGITLVTPEGLFTASDFLSLHQALVPATRGRIGAAQLGLMKPTAWLINTARGPLVQEDALLAVLRDGRIAGAALDVFDTEPLPLDHPFRHLPNVIATPHLGYVSREQLTQFYQESVANIAAWLST